MLPAKRRTSVGRELVRAARVPDCVLGTYLYVFGHEPGGRPAWTSTRDPVSVSAGVQARDPDAGD